MGKGRETTCVKQVFFLGEIMDILKFIGNFKKGSPKEIIEIFFTQNNCYHFAVILTNMFDGNIIYDIDNNHFISEINGYYYDITGLVEEPLNSYMWKDMEEKDPIEYDSVYEACVMMK